MTTHKNNVDNNNMPTTHKSFPPMGLKTKQELCESPQRKRELCDEPNHIGLQSHMIRVWLRLVEDQDKRNTK